MDPIVYYITAHGYGHGVRSCDIIRAFHRRHPEVPFVLATDLPEAFLRNRLPGLAFTVRPVTLDVGMVQRDSVRSDVAASLKQALALAEYWPQLVAAETDYLRSQPVGLVVADIPAIPLEAAARAGVPAAAVGNFSWNWIYAALVDRDARWSRVVELFEAGYRRADLLLRLPFAEPMTAFPRQCTVPLVAEPATPRRAGLAALTGAPLDRRWVLLSFSTLDWDEAALDRVAALDAYAFFTMRPLAWARDNLYAVDREQMPFSTVIASCDAVVTKPGYGILSECVVNRKPMLYVDRTDFAEYAVLEAAVQRYLRHRHIPAEQLYRGGLGAGLEALWSAPEPREHPPADGGRAAAEQLAKLYRPGPAS
jgi:UDP:flavonoid glycosyltransferase YjiC (YdhE family)